MNERVDTSLADSLANVRTGKLKVDVLFAYMERNGNSFYDESVTELEHGLQAAFLAKANQATDMQVTAALLHDIGHFVMNEEAGQGNFSQEDWCHETVGAELLELYFPDVIIESIRQHVPAKRYLCAIDSHYHEGLSPASQNSLNLQGGKFSPAEVLEFEQNPHLETILLVRRWDDGAKTEGLKVPGLESYRDAVESCLLAGHG
ncbi:hypothetical protein FF011L_22640 [Roseimaritima multifibrata]|uniref:HD domain-containing protein n=1 Tax=Roseimaritima multifibrata TaxID=1930274 RepID=A0A517MF29_9BACT|nr:HD domain-containing protein [Roseimaritima multifibrata]QDS93494.1 hypothetical protein FF011L_22640 [Roseimaritima multifibrata]